MKSLLLFIPLLLLAYSCKEKDSCRDRESKPVRELLLKSIPYTNGQTVTFTNNKLGLVTTTVERKMTLFQPDSPKICEEIYEINLVEKSSGFNYIGFLLRGTADDSLVQFTLSPYKSNRANIIQYAVRDNGDLHSFLFNGVSVLHDTLTLSRILYKNVLELIWDQREDPQDVTRLFYNTEFGILRYETKDGMIGYLSDMSLR